METVLPASLKTAPEKGHIYALLAGINAYDDAPLNGCLKDVARVENYLATQYPADRVKLRVLRDEEATYENLLAGFQTHLKMAGPEDTIWFHFSGHGTEAFTAEEFLPIEPNGKDQCLVCYEGDKTRNFLLADKELAWLLDEVATKDIAGNPKETPHIVVSLDCCHSGSGTRDHEMNTEIKTRMLTADLSLSRSEAFDTGLVRKLDTYVGGAYAREFAAKGNLEIPAAKHALLAACESVQLAGDMPEGGVFTTSLIKALTGAQGNLNYADLFVRTRATARAIRDAQTPQFETIAKFDAFTLFLEGTSHGTPDRYEIEQQGDAWFVKCGAIHGIPMNPKAPVEIDIQTDAPENRSVAKAWLTAVGAQMSQLQLEEGAVLSPEAVYQGIMHFLPVPPAQVWIHGDPQTVALLQADWDDTQYVRAVQGTEEVGETCEYEVRCGKDQFEIYDRIHKRTVTWMQADKRGVTFIMDALGKMVKWERTIHLNNGRSRIRDWMDFELSVKNQKMQALTLEGSAVELVVSPQTFFSQSGGIIGAPFYPKVVFKDVKQRLHCYLLHLRSNYSIESYEGEIIFRPEEHLAKRVVVPLWKKQWGWGLSGDENSSTSYFKLLVTTEQLDYQQLLQSGIDGDRSMVLDWNPFAVKDDWCSYTIKVKMLREGSNTT